MKTFTQTIFSILFGAFLFLIVNQNVRGQWELLLGEEGKDWLYQDMKVTEDGGLLLITKVDNDFRLLKINILGKLIWNRSFHELNLPDDEFINPNIQLLQNGEHLLFYSTDSLETNKRLARMGAYGEPIWVNDADFYGEIIELKSGNYLQVTSVEIEDISVEDERDIVATAFSREDGSVLWKEVYATEVDEQIWKRKWTSDGNYMIAGKSDRHHIFTMLFSDEGEHIGGYTYDFEGENLDIPENGDEHFLFDIEITSDEGLITLRTFKIPNEFFYYPYLTLEKFDKFGNVEWSKTYGDDIEDNYNAWESSGFRVRQDKQGDYVLYGDFITDLEILPNVGRVSSEGYFLWESAYYDLIYNDWVYHSKSTYLEPLKSGNYLLFGFGENYVNHPSTVSKIPFAAKIDDSGKLKWGEFYDLGKGEDLFFEPKTTLCYDSQICYTASSVIDLHPQKEFLYIFSINENGLRYENLVSGEIFLDSNENCEKEETDKGLYAGIVVTIDSPEFTRYAYTDLNGNFSAEIPIGDYTISYTLDNDLVELGCGQNEYTVNFTENYDTLTNLNFALRPVVECPKLEVEIGTPLLRRCFKNTYKVSYCNKGTLAAEDAKISLEFPDAMVPLQSSIPALQEGQQWTFDLGRVDIGECGFFMVTDSISCEAELGSTLCLKSRILPNDPCEALSPLWDGSNVEVSGDCVGENVRFTMENIGSGQMNEERQYVVYENNVLTETGKIQLKNGERRQLYLNPNGRSLQLKVEQSPYFPNSNDEPQAFVEACGTGNFSYGYINSVEQNDRPPSIDIDCQTIIGSFDPNDIQVSPTGVTEKHFIEESTKLTYKIRFQNTGNDTAFRVMVVDTLPRELEGATLNLGSSSHDYTFDILFGNLLVWTFNDILLPDSTTNEAESHGFVQFSISPKAGLEMGTKIENKADIYFDFNAPVATNQVFNTVTDDLEVDFGTPLSLKVTFIDFEAEALENNSVEIKWIYINSENISHFEVERSSNPYIFETVHKVETQKGDEEAHIYQIEDEYTGTENVLYYRIKAVEVTGNYERTYIKMVLLDSKPAKYQVWSSNRKQILIEWLGEKEENYTIQVFNTVGQHLFDFEVDWFRTIFPHLESNVYIFRIVDGERRDIESQKVFVR
ncbi:MAG: hypothetical protein R3E32_28940 [Chitinophagales bacterium]